MVGPWNALRADGRLLFNSSPQPWPCSLRARGLWSLPKCLPMRHSQWPGKRLLMSAALWLSLCQYEKIQTLQYGVQGPRGLDTTLLPSSILSFVPWPALLASMFLIEIHHPFSSTCINWITLSFWPLHQQNWKLLQVYHPFLSTPHGPDYSSTLTTSSENSLGLFHLSILSAY